ncbi:DUF933 domain-containing protein [Candidatus Microgenomates bacterium]|nr:DUF933 domain-containing protein [Candidatus Microgenomates bacterium]
MSLKIGIVGLPNTGRSTLFNLLLKRQFSKVADYPFTTTDSHTGVIEVPDERVKNLASMLGAEKIFPATIQFLDIAGLVKGSHHGQGLGNDFLAHIREADAILHVVRFFDHVRLHMTSEYATKSVPHVMGSINPTRDIEVVKEELRLAGIKKPTLYLINIDKTVANDKVTIEKLRQKLQFEMKIDKVIFSCVKNGENEDGNINTIIDHCFKLLNLIIFYTLNRGVLHAWSIKEGKTILEAIKETQADSNQNFPQVEVIGTAEILSLGNWQKAKEVGKVQKVEDDYLIQDGDIVSFQNENHASSPVGNVPLAKGNPV